MSVSVNCTQRPWYLDYVKKAFLKVRCIRFRQKGYIDKMEYKII